MVVQDPTGACGDPIIRRQTVPPMESSALGTIKRGYAAGAQATGRLLERVGVLDEDPPPRDRSTTPLGVQPDEGPRLARDRQARRAVVDVRGDRRGRAVAGRSGPRRAGVRVGIGGQHDLARPPGGFRAVRRAPPRVRHDDSGAAGGLAQRNAGHRRTRTERGSGDPLGEGRPWRTRLRRVRRPHRQGRRDVRADRRRRPGSPGVPDRRPRAPRTGRDHRVRQHDAPPLPTSDRRCARSSKRSTGASPPRSPTPTKPAS